MIYILSAIILVQSFAMVYIMKVNKPVVLTEEAKEKERKEKIEKDWQKLFNYNETIATRGYKE